MLTQRFHDYLFKQDKKRFPFDTLPLPVAGETIGRQFDAAWVDLTLWIMLSPGFAVVLFLAWLMSGPNQGAFAPTAFAAGAPLPGEAPHHTISIRQPSAITSACGIQNSLPHTSKTPEFRSLSLS